MLNLDPTDQWEKFCAFKAANVKALNVLYERSYFSRLSTTQIPWHIGMSKFKLLKPYNLLLSEECRLFLNGHFLWVLHEDSELCKKILEKDWSFELLQEPDFELAVLGLFSANKISAEHTFTLLTLFSIKLLLNGYNLEVEQKTPELARNILKKSITRKRVFDEKGAFTSEFDFMIGPYFESRLNSKFEYLDFSYANKAKEYLMTLIKAAIPKDQQYFYRINNIKDSNNGLLFSAIETCAVLGCTAEISSSGYFKVSYLEIVPFEVQDLIWLARNMVNFVDVIAKRVYSPYMILGVADINEVEIYTKHCLRPCVTSLLSEKIWRNIHGMKQGNEEDYNCIAIIHDLIHVNYLNRITCINVAYHHAVIAFIRKVVGFYWSAAIWHIQDADYKGLLEYPANAKFISVHTSKGFTMDYLVALRNAFFEGVFVKYDYKDIIKKLVELYNAKVTPEEARKVLAVEWLKKQKVDVTSIAIEPEKISFTTITRAGKRNLIDFSSDTQSYLQTVMKSSTLVV